MEESRAMFALFTFLLAIFLGSGVLLFLFIWLEWWRG